MNKIGSFHSVLSIACCCCRVDRCFSVALRSDLKTFTSSLCYSTDYRASRDMVVKYNVCILSDFVEPHMYTGLNAKVNTLPTGIFIS